MVDGEGRAAVGTAARVLRGWGALLVPLCCPGCGAEDVAVCTSCRARLLRGPLLHRPLVDGTTAVASAPFRGPARGLVSAAKERGRHDVGVVLGAALARAVAGVGWGPARTSSTLLLVPPPGRLTAVLRRAERPTAVLAGAAADRLGDAGADVRVVEALRLVRAVRDQAGLDRPARAENLSGAVAVRGRLPPGQVVVVDDVLTSGATVLACADALRRAGADVLGAAVVAAA